MVAYSQPSRNGHKALPTSHLEALAAQSELAAVDAALTSLRDLPPGAPLTAVERALRLLEPATLWLDPLGRAMLREALLHELKRIGVSSPARLADIALGDEERHDTESRAGQVVDLFAVGASCHGHRSVGRPYLDIGGLRGDAPAYHHQPHEALRQDHAADAFGGAGARASAVLQHHVGRSVPGHRGLLAHGAHRRGGHVSGLPRRATGPAERWPPPRRGMGRPDRWPRPRGTAVLRLRPCRHRRHRLAP